MHRRLTVTLKVEGTDKETRHSFEYRKQGEVEAEVDLTDVPHQFIVNRLVGLLEAVAIAADHVWPAAGTPPDMTAEFAEADRILAAGGATSPDEVMAVVDGTPVPIDDYPASGAITAEEAADALRRVGEASGITVGETPVGDTIETAGEQDAGERELEF